MTSSEVDVVIVGSGAAGLSAVLTTRQEGLDVLILEKADRIGGTSAIAFLAKAQVVSPVLQGGATVTLTSESADVTILVYEVDAQIGGKLAQLGGRLIDSTSRRLAGQFFAAFGEAVGNAAATSV